MTTSGLPPSRVHEKVRRTCQDAFELFSKQVSPQHADTPAFSRSKKYSINIDDQQFLELIASPVISPAGHVVQVVAVVWDATSTRRLQQKIDAIDKAGRELVRLESDAICKMSVADRLKVLEDKIISFTRELMHFDHFAIRLLDRRSNRLELVISAGLPPDALNMELYCATEGNGISGYVAATGRSYICPDVERDPRYVMGLDSARSSLTVPLSMHDRVIGIFNIESRQRAAFNEDDRQFAEILGMDVSYRALEIAQDKLRLERLPPAQRERIRLIQGSLIYRDKRLESYDAAAVVEVIEHLDPPRLAAFERVLFEFARPKTVVITTPNIEYNPKFESLPAGRFRHRDHRFEWTRAEFEAWARNVGERFGYAARFLPVGPEDAAVGAPSQMGVFERL